MIINDLFLTEMIWEDRFTAGEAIKKFPNALIHFAKGIPHPMGDRGSKPTSPEVPKLGVNPSGMKPGATMHRDPPGMYFYPCHWLASEEASLSQYATNYEFYYVCSFKPTANTINLATVTRAKAEALAQRNGWFEDMERIRANPELLNNDNQPMEKTLLRKAGGFLWACMDYLANVEKKSWMALLKGVDAIIDPGFGFIASGEPAQTIVFKRNLLTILAHGTNTDNFGKVVGGIVREMGMKIGANISYHDKEIVLDIENNGRPCRLSITLYESMYPIAISYFKEGFWITTRERHYYNTNTGDVAEYIRYITYNVEKAMKDAGERGPNLYWTADKAKQVLNSIRLRGSRTRESVDQKKGILHISYNDSWGPADFWMMADINKKDRVKFIISMNVGRDDPNFKYEVQQSFSNKTTVEQATQIVRQKLVDQIKSKTPDAADRVIKYFTKIGFDLGYKGEEDESA